MGLFSQTSQQTLQMCSDTCVKAARNKNNQHNFSWIQFGGGGVCENILNLRK